MDPVLDPATPDCRGPWNHTERREILAAGVSETDSYAIRPATLTGEPLGSTEFVARLERETARRLLPGVGFHRFRNSSPDVLVRRERLKCVCPLF